MASLRKAPAPSKSTGKLTASFKRTDSGDTSVSVVSAKSKANANQTQRAVTARFAQPDKERQLRSARSEGGLATGDDGSKVAQRTDASSSKMGASSIKSSSAYPVRTEPSAAMKKKMEDAANKPRFVSRRPVTYFARFNEKDSKKNKKLKATRSMPLGEAARMGDADSDDDRRDTLLDIDEDSEAYSDAPGGSQSNSSAVSIIGPALYSGEGHSPTASELGGKPGDAGISDAMGRDIVEALNEMKEQLKKLEDHAAAPLTVEKGTSALRLSVSAEPLPEMRSPRTSPHQPANSAELRDLVSKSNKLEQLTDEGKCVVGEKAVVAPQVISPVDMAELLAALANVRLHLTDAKNSAVQLELKRKHAVQENNMPQATADDDSVTSEGTTQLRAHKEKYKSSWARVKEDYFELQAKYEHVKEDRNKLMAENEKLRKELNDAKRELKQLRNQNMEAGLAADVAAVGKGGVAKRQDFDDDDLGDEIPTEDTVVTLPSQMGTLLPDKNLVVLSGAIEAFQAEYGVRMTRMPTGKYEVAGKRVSIRLVGGELVARRSGKYVSLREYIFPKGKPQTGGHKGHNAGGFELGSPQHFDDNQGYIFCGSR
eukprot:GEMP01010648.1.p1 GENE.GEMP01010648.1~~GEMP01010648.1.p1  ORF type:complete len:598 (+),score=180.09 GEMP01010648.1:139-1932(+)